MVILSKIKLFLKLIKILVFALILKIKQMNTKIMEIPHLQISLFMQEICVFLEVIRRQI